VNKKILFVDDDPSAPEFYREILQGEFEIAVSGEEGLLALRDRGPYATVIADVQCPEWMACSSRGACATWLRIP
jgi:CheY-like chemotaxis protein